MSKRAHFHRSAEAARAVWPRCAHRLLLLTGQSNLRSSALSSSQADFLSLVAHLPLEAVGTGFPFDEAAISSRRPSLLAASVQNARQYLWARHQPAYGKTVAEALQPILASAGKGILFVTGSCGLQILEAAWPHLRRAPELRVEILALGPVGRVPQFGAAGFRAVQGSADIWSRLLYRGPVTHRADCGHLDYWHDAIARDALKNSAERLLTEVR